MQLYILFCQILLLLDVVFMHNHHTLLALLSNGWLVCSMACTHTAPFASCTRLNPGSKKTKEQGCFFLVCVPFPDGWANVTSAITCDQFVTIPICPLSCPVIPFMMRHRCPSAGCMFPHRVVCASCPNKCCHWFFKLVR